MRNRLGIAAIWAPVPPGRTLRVKLTLIAAPPDPSTWFADSLDYPKACTRCGRPTYRVDVTRPADTGRRYVRGCDCHPRPPHDPISPSNPL